MKEVKKRIAKYDPVAQKKYRDNKKATTKKITIEGVCNESAEAFKKQCEALGLSQRELFEKTFI
jgi:hypothetical protein